MHKYIKKLVISAAILYTKSMSFFKTRTFLDTPNSGIILIVSFLICGALSCLGIPLLQRLAAGLFSLILVSIFSLYWLELDSKLIKKITKNESNNPKELLKKMTHTSFLYGLLIFSLEVWYFLEMITFLFFRTFFGIEVLLDAKNAWLFVIFFFGFIYFCYHIYLNPERLLLKQIQQRIEFYACIGTTVGFIMLVSREILDLKILFSGLAFVFAWLKYLINSENLSAN